MFYSYNLPIYATENDLAWRDETAAVNELQRHHYLNDKIDAVGESLAAGTDIRGYSSGASSLTTVNVVTMNAVYLNDTEAKSTRCYPVPSGLCNLRSAWAACELIPKLSQCVISLPSHSTLLWNSNLGALILDDESNILIEGRSTEIIRTGFETRNSPPRYSGPEKFTADFPLDTHRLSNTASATRNYAQGCLQLCEKDYVKLSSCNDKTVGDTWFRLFDENDLEVSENDDYCIAGAQIVYKKESVGCSEFCLHAGCFSQDSCSAYVQLFNLTAGGGVNSDVSVASPRFIEYLNTTASSIPTLTVRNLHLKDFGDFGFVNIDAGSDGGSVMLIGDCFATFESVVFNSSRGNYGGAMYLDANVLGYVHIDRCLFYNNSACGGGAITIYDVSGFAVTNSVFLHCYSKQFGGAIVFLGHADHVLISNATFYSCISRSAGAIDLQTATHFITIVDSTFEGCRALGGFGSGGLAGAVRMTGCTYARIIRSVFRDCSSIAVAGALSLNEVNDNLEITSCVFENCASVSGGCIYAFSEHKNLSISNTTLSGCVASAYGGGIYFGYDNQLVSIEDTSIVNSSATIGGGLYLDTNNNHFTLKNVFITGCAAKVGGGIALDAENAHFHLVHSRVERCSALTYGGGINIETANSDFSLLRCNLSANSAKYGGALASNKDNVGLTIAGSIVSGNSAEKSGGGVYLVTGHSQFAVIDAVGNQKTVVVESEHPYKSAYAAVGQKVHVIYSKTVIVAGATGFVLNLDAATDVAFTDILAIYTDSSKSKRLYASNTTATPMQDINSNLDYPGSTTPSLRVASSSFFVEFIHNPASIFPATAYSDNHYGFKLYAYPIMGKQPQWPSVFQYNRASSGGAIFMYYDNLFSVLVSTVICDNIAMETGGGVMLRNSNKGAFFQNVQFTRNYCGSDGGALVLSLAQYGNTVYNCEFDSNSALGAGGAVSLFSDNGNALPRGDGILLHNNEITFVQASFFNNSASSGGAIMAGTTNVLSFIGCNFTQNHATSNGGTVALETANTLSLNQCNIAANEAVLCGAGIYSVNLNSITVESSSFRENSGGSGAAMCVRSGTSVAFEKACLMSKNSAKLGGGAISSFDSPLWSMASTARLTLSNNTASVGSALYVSGLQSSNESLQNIRFTNNVASVGGTVFWLKDSTMVSEPPGLHHPSVIWNNNHAPYGAKSATQALEVIGNTSISLSLCLLIL
jgi:predicted outer membrane repeat protein